MKKGEHRRPGQVTRKSRTRSSGRSTQKLPVSPAVVREQKPTLNKPPATVNISPMRPPDALSTTGAAVKKALTPFRPNLQPEAAARPRSIAGTRDKTGASLGNATERPVRVFQIFYEDWHRELLDADFVAYDNRGATSELHDFAVFEKLAESREIAGARHWGALSWRFSEKTGMSGNDWLAAIAARPGFDVYFCNPFPENEALYHNVWIQGEPSHPSFIELVTAVFNAAGLPLEHLTAISASGNFSAANYFVATPAFWDSYLRFVRVVLGKAERRMPARMRALLHSRAADQRNFHFGATYVPFIVERLFTTFVTTEGSKFKACRIPLPARERQLNVHLRLLREMKDVAHKTNSKWLAACWVNYRNLYLNNTHGREWCDKYLRSITPRSVIFAGASGSSAGPA